MEAFFAALGLLSDPIILGLILVGTLVGVFLGILPGVSGGFGIVLILPFLFGHDPLKMLIFICSMYAVSYTGGSLTAILVGIPGDTGSAATLQDGHPMAQKGLANQAMGAAVSASMFGGFVSIVFAFAMMPLVLAAVLLFRSPEMLLIIVLGLCFLAIVSRGSMIKGLISGSLGLLFSCVGMQTITGVPRLTFGSLYLYDGIGVIVVLMGLFALPTLIELSASGEAISSVTSTSKNNIREMFTGSLAVFKHWKTWLRSAIIGYVVGVIPGVGGEVAIWTSYGIAKKMSKNPETFGTGNIEGVIAPESANNAKAGGALLTTIALGIPGSSEMVLFLAAFLIMGLQPGPKMLTEHADISFAMLITVALTNVIAAVICFISGPFLVKITRISFSYIICSTIPLILVGVYAYNDSMLDMVVLFGVGIIGILMKKFGYSLPALLLGFVLGNGFEYYFWHSMDMHGLASFLSPLSIILIIMVVLLLFWNLLKKLFDRISILKLGRSV